MFGCATEASGASGDIPKTVVKAKTVAGPRPLRYWRQLRNQVVDGTINDRHDSLRGITNSCRFSSTKSWVLIVSLIHAYINYIYIWMKHIYIYIYVYQYEKIYVYVYIYIYTTYRNNIVVSLLAQPKPVAHLKTFRKQL